MLKEILFAGLFAFLVCSCSTQVDFDQSEILGIWKGHLVHNYELSYAFDTHGYLPVKVVDMPVEGSIEFDFNKDSVLLTIENESRISEYTLTRKAGFDYLIVEDEDKILELRIVKVQDDMLELEHSIKDKRILSKRYILSRKG